ncbi:hypothetical protein H9635_12920 [Solibacillus sp. A46]|uniref:Uncharacterized protein n=1 Tax=Solibacillus faecavium TaxID=2762221 RepID=A0ABR8Y0F4_9BACL|nr:hypothetical protein [Solibacillus faecavium]MBD8037646.1 hypothetical protein [Solibacillus faecavium]
MKISSIVQGSNLALEDRKRSLQRKEASEIYKKHAKYTDTSKNPLLEALEHLLSGKTEKELHDTDVAARTSSHLPVGESKNQPKEFNPLENEDVSFVMPKKFQKDLARNRDEQTLNDLDKLLFQRSFNTATQKYNSHIAMVNNGYRSIDEPIFSQIA